MDRLCRSASYSRSYLVVCIFMAVLKGIGMWGVNSVVVWGFAIANYVWWIGIGNAGTLISAMLLLTRQKWRAVDQPFRRSDDAICRQHRRPVSDPPSRPAMYFYWLTPYPNTMTRLAAMAQRADLGFLGDPQLHPVLDHFLVCRPHSRPRHASRPRQRRICPHYLWRSGARLARSARHWHPYERLHLTLACLGVPLVVSLHSVVGMDFAASLMPGWQETIFPPYFVVGAMYSGFAMVVCLAALVRWGFRMQGLSRTSISTSWQDMLAAAIVMGLSYATEWFNAWYDGERADRSLVIFELTGAYAPMYCALLFCNVVVPQVFWLRAVRQQHRGRVRHRHHHQYRHVARAHPDRLEHTFARLLCRACGDCSFRRSGIGSRCSARSGCSR